jgi:dipeptidyl aminopeptidase/acylaminoacyl peptidase
MKKLFLLLLLVLTQWSFAQQVNILSVEKIKETNDGGYYHPKFSPGADYLLLTKMNYQGLVQYTLSDKSLKILNHDPGAGYGVKMSADGSSILYKKVELVQNRRHNALVSQNLQSGEKKVLVKATREPITAELINSQPVYVQGKKMVKAPVKTSAPQQVITIENQKMVLYTNGNRKEITPSGKDASYIWPSISPDGKQIVYTVAGKGTFICSVSGRNVVSIGKLNAPKWAGNNFLVGMDDKDNGEKIISSDVLIVSANGKLRKKIDAPEGVMAIYPAASASGNKIAFSSQKGEIYIANVELK